MKQFAIHLSIAVFCLALLASCSLDEDPRDQIPEGKVFTNEETLVRNTIATLYNYIGGSANSQGLQGTIQGVYDMQTFTSDEAMIPTRGVDWYDGGYWQDLYKHKWSAGTKPFHYTWLYLYKVITLCNSSLETLKAHLDILDQQSLAVYTAEVRALRAIYYWYLIDFFGNVPLITSTDISIDEVKQSSRVEVFNFIEKELLESCSYITGGNSAAEGEYYGRVTLSVAYFALAKFYLNAEVYTGTPRWEDCIRFCDRLEEHGYQLEPNIANNFAVHNESSQENIWVIPMNKHLYRNQQQNIFRSLHYRHAAAYGFKGENGSCATRRALEIHGYGQEGKEDNRVYFNYWLDNVYGPNGNMVLDRTGNPLKYEPWEVELDLSKSPYIETAGARMAKYAIDPTALMDGKLMENDIVLFRYADVLLMRAEAKLRSGLDGQADYDAVRQRANMPTRPITLQNLLDERLMELCWEGWRRQDLIRFGQFQSLYDGPGKVDESDGHTCLFPIPTETRASNPNLKQNKGYK